MSAEFLRLLVFFFSLFPWNDPDTLLLERNLSLDSTRGRDVTINLLLPAAPAEPVPAVVVVHGGMWLMGSSIHYPILRRHLVAEGFACASVDYMKTVEGGYEGQINDIKEAIRFLRSNAEQYDIDPNRIGLFGSSAGGHLAGLAGLTGGEDVFGADPEGTSSAVQALFLLYGVYDLLGTIDNPITRQMVGGGSPEEARDLYVLYSPITHVDPTDPPTYLMHGDEDVVAPIIQAQALQVALEAAGVPVTLTEVPGGRHGFYRTKPLLRPEVYEAISGFFQEQLMPE